MNQEEVNEKTSNELKYKGAPYHIQAVFFSTVCKEVVQNKNPMLQPLKAHVKDRNRKIWAIASQIIEDYLSKNQMLITIATINTEDPNYRKRTINLNMELSLKSKESAIEQLIRYTAKRRKLPVKQKISEDYLGHISTNLIDE